MWMKIRPSTLNLVIHFQFRGQNSLCDLQILIGCLSSALFWLTNNVPGVPCDRYSKEKWRQLVWLRLVFGSKQNNKNRKVNKQHGEAGEWNTTQVKDCTNNLLWFALSWSRSGKIQQKLTKIKFFTILNKNGVESDWKKHENTDILDKNH